MDYLKSQATSLQSSHSDLAEIYTELQQCYEKQLWYQFSNTLLLLIHNKHFAPHANDLYTNTIKSIQFKLNQINLCKFLVYCVQQLKSTQAKIDFLQNVETDILQHIASLKKQTKITLIDINEYLYSKLIIQSQLTVQRMYQYNDIEKIEPLKDSIDANITELNNFGSTVDSYVHSNIYYTQLIYYKYIGPATQYFTSALNYLTYVDISEISADEQKQLSQDIGIAALLGTTIYNYGELLSHPLIRSLQSNDNTGWLWELLTTCNNGEIDTFERSYKQYSSKNVALHGNEKQEFLFEKVRIMKLINTIFQRKSVERTISFNEISTICKVKLNYVEWLLMKSLSLGVIKGEINEITQTIRITWVQPRVLNTTQIQQIEQKLDQWNSELNKNITFLEQNGAELIKVE